MTTNHDLDQAREWAKDPSYQGDVPSVAAARVIASLPDEWIDAANLREVIGMWDALLADDDHEDMHGMLDDLRALFPAPQPRTLADMTLEEREACQWMQAISYHDSGHEAGTVVIAQIQDDRAVIMLDDGSFGSRYHQHITPLPDLPRMVWPEEQATEEDMSIIPPKIDTSTGHDDFVDMTPEDAPDGYYLVHWWGEEHPVPAEKVQGQWWVIGKETFLHPKDVFIVSRLVPEAKA